MDGQSVRFRGSITPLPTPFTPDGAGIVHIPAVEAGEHRLRVGEKELTVTVPPLAKSQEPVKVTP